MASVLAGAFGISSEVCEAAATLVKQPEVYSSHIMETTPIVYQGQQILFASHRVEPGTIAGNTYLQLLDVATGAELSRFGDGYSLGSAYVSGNQINVYASNLTANDWFHDIYRFTSTDGINWSTPTLALSRTGGEHLLNSSVTQDPAGYLMAYESDTPVGFCFKFARSTDLATWNKLDVPAFAGPSGTEYSACPVIRYNAPDSSYYAIYLHTPISGHNGYISYIARSKDLTTWEYSDKNPVLEAGVGAGDATNEGSNNSDVDLIEIDGKTYVYYATGDQMTWGDVKRAIYDGSMSQFFQSYFPAPASPQSVTWTGNTNSLWSDTANWGGNATANNNVRINGGPNQPVISTTDTVNDLWVGASASGTLTIADGANLTVGGPSGSSFNIGVDGTGTVNQTGGTMQSQSGDGAYLGVGSTGTYNLSGGTATFGFLAVGLRNTGLITVSGGTMNFNGQVQLDSWITNAGNGTITQTGGTINLNANITHDLNSTALGIGTSTLNINGGVFNILGAVNSITVDFLNIGGDAGAAVFSTASGQTITVNKAMTVNLDFTNDQTYAGPINGAGTLAKSGAGTLTLSGANGYSGATTISAGRISVFSAGALGNTPSVTVADGATLFLGAAGTYTAPITISGIGITEYAGNLGALRLGDDITYAGNVTLAANAGILHAGNGSNGTITGNIGGNYQLDIRGGVYWSDSVITLAPTTGNNTYGSTKVESAARVVAGNAGAYSTGALMMNGGTLDTNGYNFTFANLSGDSGAIRNNSATTGSIITIGDGSSTSYGGTIVNGGAAALGLTKIGAGTLTLSGVNTYSGLTTVSGGVLNVTGSLTSKTYNKVVIAASTAGYSAGPKFVYHLGSGVSLVDFGSTVTGGGMTSPSTAQILYGTTDAATDLTMQWRQPASSDSLVSDVISLSGMGTGTTETFVLQMSYDDLNLARTGRTDQQLRDAGFLYLGYNKSNVWVNAGLDINPLAVRIDGAWNSSYTTPGQWGVDIVNNTVWAVVNHNSEFAVVPEPGTLILLAAGLIGLLAYAWPPSRWSSFFEVMK